MQKKKKKKKKKNQNITYLGAKQEKKKNLDKRKEVKIFRRLEQFKEGT